MARPRVFDNPRERHRAALARRDLKQVTVYLPSDLLAALDDFLQFRPESRSDIVAKLISTQLLRKR